MWLGRGCRYPKGRWMCKRDKEICNDGGIMTQMLFWQADGLRFIRLDVALCIIDRRKEMRNAVRMEWRVSVYSVHMSVDERRKELRQRKQE